MGSETRRRPELIQVRVTKEEKEMIKRRAESCASGTTAHYLRALGLDSGIKTKVDLDVAHQLVKLSADMGRVGGLVKLFIAERKGRTTAADFGVMNYYIERLELTREEIAKAIKQLV